MQAKPVTQIWPLSWGTTKFRCSIINQGGVGHTETNYMIFTNKQLSHFYEVPTFYEIEFLKILFMMNEF